MLKLSRKSKENIIIGDDIQIIVLAINKDEVLIGINAPNEVPVHRQEIYERIHHKPFKLTKSVVAVNDRFLKEKVIL